MRQSLVTSTCILAAVLVSWVVVAAAATGSYTGESKAPHGKYCHYDVQSKDHTIEVPNTAMCMRTHEFPSAPPGPSTSAAPPAASGAVATLRARPSRSRLKKDREIHFA